MRELEKRRVIESHFNHGQSATEIWKHVKYLQISRATVYRHVQRLRNGGDSSRKLGSGGKIPEASRVARKKIAARLHRKPAQSLRKIAREIKIPKTTAQRIVRRDMKLKARKKEKKQALTSPQKVKREKRSRALRRSLEGNSQRRVLFCDEKNFMMDQPLNRQNDRVYIKEGTKKPLNKNTIVERNKFSRKLMVWAGVAHNVKTDLVFFKQGDNLNADRYLSDILAPIVVPTCRKHNLHFQQDSAPCHTATKISEYLKSENVGFWTKEAWPPNSPDLNPLDYGIWGMMEQEVYRIPPTSLQNLKRKIQLSWKKLDLSKVNRCIDQFKVRLRRCEISKGGHFESN